jgi:uncharacterized protein (AIM24 family)
MATNSTISITPIKKKNNKSGIPNQKNQKNNPNNRKRNEIFLITNIDKFRNKSRFPQFSIEGGDGSQAVKFYLKKGESIRANGGAMNYMSRDIMISTQTDNFFNAAKRAISGSTIFYNIFSNEIEEEQFISLSGVNLGSMACFYIPKGKKIKLISESYICSTPNLRVHGKAAFGGVITGYGLFYVIVEALDSDGLLWASSFGKILEIELKPEGVIKVDNGILLGMDDELAMETMSIGGLKSFFLSGEGLITKITNISNTNKYIFLESRSKLAFSDYIRKIVENKMLEQKVGDNFISGFF